MAKAAEGYALGPTRVQFQNKDPRGWKEFADQLAEHSTQGSARTMRGVQARRPSLFDLVDQMKTITAPTLIMTGDEDWPCLEPALLMKRTIPTAALVVMPNAGHTINLEDPIAFNAHIADFFHTVDVGAWRKRDPRADGVDNPRPLRVASAAENSGRRVAAVDQHVRASHKTCGIACQKHGGLGDFLRLAEPIKQMLRPSFASRPCHVAIPQ